MGGEFVGAAPGALTRPAADFVRGSAREAGTGAARAKLKCRAEDVECTDSRNNGQYLYRKC